MFCVLHKRGNDHGFSCLTQFVQCSQYLMVGSLQKYHTRFPKEWGLDLVMTENTFTWCPSWWTAYHSRPLWSRWHYFRTETPHPRKWFVVKCLQNIQISLPPGQQDNSNALPLGQSDRSNPRPKWLFCLIPLVFIHVLYVSSAKKVVGKSILRAR